MKKVKLGEVCDVFSGYAFKSFNEVRKGKPVIKIGNVLSNGKIEIEDCSYTEEIPQKKYLSQKNDIYVALSGATTGKVGLMQKEGFLINQRVGVVRLKNNEVPINYIYSFLQSKTSKILEDAFGAAQPNISPKDILNYEIFIGENAEMQKIADRLDKVSSLIEKRKTQLTKLDQLIKSRFIEMFGDPTITDKNKLYKPMTSICEIIDGDRGKNYPKQEEFYEDGYCLFLNAKNVTSNGFDFTNCMFITKDKDELLRKGKLNRGDVVLTTRGTIGNLAYYSDDVLFDNVRINSGMVILRMNHEVIDEIFFIEQFKLQLAEIKEKIASGSAQPQLPISTMNKIQMLVPKISKQIDFTNFVEQTNKSKLAIQKSIDKLETLKKSLMQQYFG